MRPGPTVLFYSPADHPVTGLLSGWIDGKGYPVIRIRDVASVEAAARRRLPVLIVIDGDAAGADALALCRTLKADPYTAVVPVALISKRHAAAVVQGWFEAGADEVLTPLFEPAEQRSRLDVLLQRTARNVSVHPSTRLPGTTEIERDLRRRMDEGLKFAVCYADIDHFKEFNDRYSYYEGDRVIYILSLILRDVVRGLCPAAGFVGHIGGDDFIFVIPTSSIQDVCGEIVSVFDTLLPHQYSSQDRRSGYFFGKDRRGHLHRVPLMTLSIGIVTNEHRLFNHPAQISELATEMKSYAKTLPGSVFVVDRRRDGPPTEGTPAPAQEAVKA